MKAKHSLLFIDKKVRLLEMKIVFTAGYLAGKLGDDSEKSMKLTLAKLERK